MRERDGWLEVEGGDWLEAGVDNSQHTDTHGTVILVLPLGTDLPCWVPVMVAGSLPLPPKHRPGRDSGLTN